MVITLEKLVFSAKKLNSLSKMEQAACRKESYFLYKSSVTITIETSEKNILLVAWIFLDND